MLTSDTKLISVENADASLSATIQIQHTDGSTVVILDGGIHHVLRPALVGSEQRLAVLASDGLRAMVRTTVAAMAHDSRMSEMASRSLIGIIGGTGFRPMREQSGGTPRGDPTCDSDR